MHDVNILDEIMPEAGAFYVMDRGYLDFERLYAFTLSAAFFVVRTKSNVLLQRRYSHPVDRTTGARSDHTVILTAIGSANVYQDALRRVSYLDVETRKRFKFRLVIRENAEKLAAEAGIEIEFIRKRNFRKEDRMKGNLARRGEQPGLVCIFSTPQITGRKG